jgi:hypothetical protein
MATKKKVPEKKVEKNIELYLLIDHENGDRYVFESSGGLLKLLDEWDTDLSGFKTLLNDGTLELFKGEANLKKVKTVIIPESAFTCEFEEE